MKILMISSYYLPYLAGAELYVKEIAERLARDGDKPVILTKKFGDYKRFEIINNVKVYRVRSFDVPLLRSFISLPRLFFMGLRLGNEADIIHSHITYPNGIVAYLVGKIKKKPYIVTLQGDELMDYPEKRMLKLLKFPIKFALRNASKVHCISKALADKAVNYFGVNKSKISIIPNGVDLAYFRKAQKIELRKKYGNKKIIVTVSRLSKKNNVDGLLKAMKYVKSKCKLLIIGDGPEGKRLLCLRKKLGVDAEFLGNIDHDKLAGYLKGSDVFARIPKTEGLGIVFLEAMASRLPIIASNVGGIPDIVKDKFNGIIVNNHDARKLAIAIDKLLIDNKARKKLIKNGENFVKDYDWEKVYSETRSLYVLK